MSIDFAHLHVASGFSMRYGASPPEELVDKAAALGYRVLGLTDRDGLYGAVRFVQACDRAGISPVLGVDLAVEDEAGEGSSSGRGRTPVRGGMSVDPRLPRITVLARGQLAGIGAGVGWARLCRLVTATHLRGERGRPVATPALIAAHAAVPGGRPESRQAAFTVLLGPDSDVGRALLARQAAQARALLAGWLRLLPIGAVAIEVVCHGGPEDTSGSAGHATRLWRLAVEAGVTCVLTAAVRHASPEGAVTVDVLDAARRLVPLDVRHLDRTTTAAHLAPAARMAAVATKVTGDSVLARKLLSDSMKIAVECVQDSRADLGVGSVQLPEPACLGIAAGVDPQAVLHRRCHEAVPLRYRDHRPGLLDQVRARLDEELSVVDHLGYATYFLTVAQVCDLIREMGVRVAARGSGAGCMINYLLGISGVDPLSYGLLMERFCTPLRAQLPDIDIDVESARRTEIYERILEHFGSERVTCVSMMDTYRVRHAIRDVGAALGLLPTEIDSIAKAFPHIRARDARQAISELPELRRSGLGAPRLAMLFDLVERLDGLPRHVALHPCGVILSNAQLLDRTPVEASWLGFPMSQFDKDDVETIGLLKLDVLGIRMQSAMAHAVEEIARVEGTSIDLDDRSHVPLDDEATFDLIQSTRTLGCFQIESPGQRELVGKFAPATFEDLIIDISLFRPGPVKSDMVTPFLQARQGWRDPDLLHPTLAPALADTCGVVVFHEQVMRIIAITTGVSLAEADEVRRALGSYDGQKQVETWWRRAVVGRGYSRADSDHIWEILAAFASFGFCKAHAAAFALPTYQSAWLKAHHPAAFLAGVLTHDPGMYPKRLILDDARNHGVAILGLDVNRSLDTYRVEALDDSGGEGDERDADDAWSSLGQEPAAATFSNTGDDAALTAPRWGIRCSLVDVKGISDAEVQAIIAGQPYADLDDFWRRAQPSRPVTERMVLAGGFDSLYGIGAGGPEGLGRRGRITRRDLLLHCAQLERWSRAVGRSTARGPGQGSTVARPSAMTIPSTATTRSGSGEFGPSSELGTSDVRSRAAAQSQAPAVATSAVQRHAQLLLDLDDAPRLTPGTGLPEMNRAERVFAELDILGLDASEHVLTPYAPMLQALDVVRASDIRAVRSRSEVTVAGVKVATQTPPVRSGRRVVFLTLDDSTGPVDATFFEDVQGPFAATVFHSWLLLVRGVVRRVGPRGVSLRATGAWELSALWEGWLADGLDGAVRALVQAEEQARALAALPTLDPRNSMAGVAGSRSSVVTTASPIPDTGTADEPGERAGGMGGGHRRVLVHPSGFKQSPYADVIPAGDDWRNGRNLAAAMDGQASGRHRAEDQIGTPQHEEVWPLEGQGPAVAPRKLWHASPGSAGH